ncbi:VOC family protein [Puniceicoccaceae bacterium K14]|nr:VOC family protein [Puniceicoccaceae bacterium K14]
MNTHEKINYVEFPSWDLTGTKRFFAEVFDWVFQDFGKEYAAFKNAGIDGGFFQAPKASSSEDGSALVVFYSEDLESTREKILEAGGMVVKETFSFPGGRRFHFAEPSGNEFAVWSDKGM